MTQHPHRVATRLLSVPAVCLMILGAVTVPAAADVPVYTDSLSSAWQNWSWNSTVNFDNATPIHAGARSTAVTYNAAWAGLYLHSNSILTASDFATLRFSIHGGAAGGHSIQVVGYDGANAAGNPVALGATAAGTWTTIDIPISSFGISTLGGLVWQDSSGAAQPTFYLDDITLIAGGAPPGAGPNLTVDATADQRAISPYIYGLNFADAGLAAELRLPLDRWGGNNTTRYNWQLDTANHASDWYFENIPKANPNPGALPHGSTSDRFVDQDRAFGTKTLMTIPMIGWTPKARAYDGGFAVSRYGPQQQTDPFRPDFGNGIRTDGAPITGNNPADTSIAIGPAFVQAWIAHLISRYGNAASGGVAFYNLDNEPALWNSTHRDVRPQALGYDELRDRTYQYGAAIKAADPSAKTVGPAEYGWSGYFYSALDMAAGGAWWNTRPDRRAHGDVPLADWYLQQMRAYELAHGVRILDYFDLHYYPQAPGVTLGPAGSAATQAMRLRSTRSLWDPTYVDESWIGEAVRLLPRMRDWVATNYPGTKLAISEYNWGGLESINGAVTQADVLGIFGREGLDLATMWDPPAPSQPGAFAFRMFRNYNGTGGAFGDTSVRATSADQGRVSVFSALRGDGALTIMMINKTTTDLTSNVALSHFTPTGNAQLYRYSAAKLAQVVRGADVSIGAGTNLTLPASSITLLVVPGGLLRGDINGDGVINANDVGPFVLVLLGLDTDANRRLRSDMNADGTPDGSDVQAFIQALAP